MTTTVGALTADNSGARVRITLPDGRSHEGVLSFARNPSYPRRDVRHWWLIVPSALPHFTHDALSLQWSGSATVELITAKDAAA